MLFDGLIENERAQLDRLYTIIAALDYHIAKNARYKMKSALNAEDYRGYCIHFYWRRAF